MSSSFFISRAPLLGALVSLISLSAQSVYAETRPFSWPDHVWQVRENSTGLPGIIRTPVPLAGPSLISLAATGRYGLYPQVGDVTKPSHQLGGDLSVAVTPLPFLSARLSVLGSANLQPGQPPDGDSSFYGEPQLALRLFTPVTDRLHLGFESELRFVGAQAPSVDPKALTPTFRALSAYQVSKKTWLALEGGFRWDNSAKALDDPAQLQDADRMMIPFSSFNALEFALGLSHRIGQTELLAEWSADFLVGFRSPGFGADPMSFSLGARHEFSDVLSLRADAEVSPTGQPAPYPDSVIIAARPRFAASVGITYRFGLREKGLPAARSQAEEEAERRRLAGQAEASQLGTLRGSLVDEGGRPLSDVLVVLQNKDGEQLKYYSDADGNFVFEDVPVGSFELHTETAGYDSFEQTTSVSQGDEQQSLEIVLYESLPEGQVRGKVLDLAGNAVAAKVSISPGQHQVRLAADGSFTVDLEPGRYTVKVQAADYRDQIRVIRVQDKGVVVLNFALEK